MEVSFVNGLRSILVFSALLLFVSAAFGEGEYQKTKDGKTTVWNSAPKPGDAATWFGDRDAEGYASGVGTLTWYTAKGNVFGRYFGNMIHGKLDGPVNVHSRGRTGHAMFVAGERNTPWATGPAPSRMINEQLPEPTKPRVAAKPEPIPARSPSPKVVAKSESTTQSTPSPSSPAVAVENSPPPEPSPPEKTGPPKEDQTLGPGLGEQNLPLSESSPPRVEATPVPSVSETAAPIAKSTPRPTAAIEEKPAETPTSAPSVEPTQAAIAANDKESEIDQVDKSLRTLVGPPSSLHMNPNVGPSPVLDDPAQSKTRSFGAVLTDDEAIGLADNEARSQGAPLDKYNRPKIDYSAVKDMWSLSYDLKDAGDAGNMPKQFTVTVEDKTKKTNLRR